MTVETFDVSDRVTVERHPDAEPPVYVIRMDYDDGDGQSEVYLTLTEAQAASSFIEKAELRNLFTTTPSDPHDYDAGDECPICGETELVAPTNGDPLEPAKPYCPAADCGWIVGQPMLDVDGDDDA